MRLQKYKKLWIFLIYFTYFCFINAGLPTGRASFACPVHKILSNPIEIKTGF